MTTEIFFENFEILADAPGSVPRLRELILQLAMQGKLVPQDAVDESASVLLEKIRAEKARSNDSGRQRHAERSEASETNDVVPQRQMVRSAHHDNAMLCMSRWFAPLIAAMNDNEHTVMLNG